jgi:hypothetical protein
MDVTPETARHRQSRQIQRTASAACRAVGVVGAIGMVGMVACMVSCRCDSEQTAAAVDGESAPPTIDWELIEQKRADQIQDLTKRYSGLIRALPPGNESIEAGRYMRALMSEWNPLYASSEDLQNILGEPSRTMTTDMPGEVVWVYVFDSGFGGSAWEFTLEPVFLEPARVVGVRRRPLT